MAQLIPFLVLAIIVIAKIMASASRQSGGGPPRSAPPRPGPTESERERRRRFMEAMGLPPDSELPSPVQPRTVANPPPLLPVNPPGVLIPPTLRRVPHTPTASVPPVRPTPRSMPSPLVTALAAAPPQPTHMETMASILQTFTAARTALAKPAPATPATPAPRISYPAKSLLLHLRDPASIREAIILREVLGPPKALQPTPPRASFVAVAR